MYERHLDHVRTQMKKVGTTNANAPGTSSYGSALTTIGGLPMRRDGSSGGLAMRRDGSGGGLAMRRDGSGGGLAMRRDGSSRSQSIPSDILTINKHLMQDRLKDALGPVRTHTR